MLEWRFTNIFANRYSQLTGIILAAVLLASVVWIDESFPPVLLARKASRIRLETKNWAVHSKSQESGTTIGDIARKYLIVPIEMLIDPICFFINLYAAFVYAIIYLAITAFPIEFGEVRGWNAVVGSVPFLAIITGVIFAVGINLYGQVFYRKRLIAAGGVIVPEARLMPMMVGSFFFAAGLFIMGWTAEKNIHWIG